MGFLREIVDETRRSLDRPAYDRGVPSDGPRTRTSFRRAIESARDAGALVVEYKKVSPGRTDSRLPDRSLPEFLEATRPAAPDAFSCVATVPRFDGSPRIVAELARSAGRPVLFKDFVVDRRQLDVAARTGASAVLLIARLESEGYLDQPLSVLAGEAHRLDLEVLLEFHGRTELSRVSDVPADVYGVNVRNLDTLAIDRATAEETLRDARTRGLRPLLGLSGIEEARDAQRFWEAGVDGVLVGSAVARASDPSGFLRGLRRPADGGAR